MSLEWETEREACHECKLLQRKRKRDEGWGQHFDRGKKNKSKYILNFHRLHLRFSFLLGVTFTVYMNGGDEATGTYQRWIFRRIERIVSRLRSPPTRSRANLALDPRCSRPVNMGPTGLNRSGPVRLVANLGFI